LTPKKKQFHEHQLSRRERQIMQAVYKAGRATVAEIVAAVPDPPTPDAIRRLCHILQEKGHLKSKPDGRRRIYFPTIRGSSARRDALRNVVDTFFDGSPHMLVATLLDSHRDKLSDDDILRLSRMIDEAEEGES
jgi:predicted transcriptional regulator